MSGEYKATCGCAIHVAQWTAKRKVVTQKSCPLHLAAKELLEAAKLTALHFERNKVSGNFQGDDEHEAWSALENAITKAESAPKETPDGSEGIF